MNLPLAISDLAFSYELLLDPLTHRTALRTRSRLLYLLRLLSVNFLVCIACKINRLICPLAFPSLCLSFSLLMLLRRLLRLLGVPFLFAGFSFRLLLLHESANPAVLRVKGVKDMPA